MAWNTFIFGRNNAPSVYTQDHISDHNSRVSFAIQIIWLYIPDIRISHPLVYQQVALLSWCSSILRSEPNRAQGRPNRRKHNLVSGSCEIISFQWPGKKMIKLCVPHMESRCEKRANDCDYSRLDKINPSKCFNKLSITLSQAVERFLEHRIDLKWQRLPNSYVSDV